MRSTFVDEVIVLGDIHAIDVVEDELGTRFLEEVSREEEVMISISRA